MATGVLLVGEQAGELAAGFAALGVQTAQSLDALESDRVFVVGIGSGAREALLHGTREDVAGVVGIDGEPPVAEARAGAFRAPVLAVVAEAHEGSAYAFAKALGNHGVLNETVVYDDVEPGFLGEHESATADVWRLLRRFMGLQPQA